MQNNTTLEQAIETAKIEAEEKAKAEFERKRLLTDANELISRYMQEARVMALPQSKPNRKAWIDNLALELVPAANGLQNDDSEHIAAHLLKLASKLVSLKAFDLAASVMDISTAFRVSRLSLAILDYAVSTQLDVATSVSVKNVNITSASVDSHLRAATNDGHFATAFHYAKLEVDRLIANRLVGRGENLHYLKHALTPMAIAAATSGQYIHYKFARLYIELTTNPAMRVGG